MSALIISILSCLSIRVGNSYGSAEFGVLASPDFDTGKKIRGSDDDVKKSLLPK
jgi:hypothetical protein